MRKFLALVAIVAMLLPAPGLLAQTSSTTTNLGVRTAASMTCSYWQNIGDNPLEYSLAKAGGVCGVRIGACVWQNVELQNPATNTSGGYALPTGCANDIKYAAQQGLQVELEAIYGAPYHQILTVTTTAAATTGATSVPVVLTSALYGDSLSTIVPFPTTGPQPTGGAYYFSNYQYTISGSVYNLTTHHAYGGTLITGVSLTDATHATLTFSSAVATGITIASGQTYQINEQLYPPATTGFYSTSPSDQAFVRYAIAQATLGLGVMQTYWAGTGRPHLSEGISNEPPWGGDPWENATVFFDGSTTTYTNSLPGNGQNQGYIVGLQDQASPNPDITYVSELADKSSTPGALGSRMLTYGGEAFKNTSTNPVTVQAQHPYGVEPEDNFWNEVLLQANTSLGSAANLVTGSTSNAFGLEASNLQAIAAGNLGLPTNITETGTSIGNGTYPETAERNATFDMRQYIIAMWDHMVYLNFYRFFELNVSGGVYTNSGYSFVVLTNGGVPCTNSTNCPLADGFTPLPIYTAMSGMMADINAIAFTPPASYSSMPAPTSYTGGAYNLNYGWFVGASSPSASKNSSMLVAYQMSLAPTGGSCPGGGASNSIYCWYNVPAPAAATATWAIPSGMQVSYVRDSVTRSAVSSTIASGSVSFQVSDRPVEVLFSPIIALTGSHYNTKRQNGMIN